MRPESYGSIDKLLDTVDSIKKELDQIKNCASMSEISQLEEHIRHECQVVEAMPGYMGQEIFAIISARRNELRKDKLNSIFNLGVKPVVQEEPKPEPKTKTKKGKK